MSTATLAIPTALAPIAPASADVAADEFAALVEKLALGAAETVSQWLSGVPAELGLLSALAFFCGLAMWLMGSRVIKPIFCGIGMTFGASVGFTALPLIFDQQVFGIDPHWVGMGVGGVFGIIVATIVMRFTIALSAAGVVATASVLIAGVWLEAERGELSPAAWTAGAGEAFENAEKNAGNKSDRDEKTANLFLRSVPIEGEDERIIEAGMRANEARRFASELAGELSAEWKEIPHQERLLLSGSGVLGSVVGLFFGLTMPRKSAAVVTAMAGSAIWLTNAAWIADAAGSSYSARVEWTASLKLLTWLFVSFLGAAWQISRLRKKRRLLAEDE